MEYQQILHFYFICFVWADYTGDHFGGHLPHWHRSEIPYSRYFRGRGPICGLLGLIVQAVVQWEV